MRNDGKLLGGIGVVFAFAIGLSGLLWAKSNSPEEQMKERCSQVKGVFLTGASAYIEGSKTEWHYLCVKPEIFIDTTGKIIEKLSTENP